MPEFLEQLNESQRAAVEYVDGASLVIAGAGSGKTRVLTYKIAYLLTLGYKPWEIMALTFTNKAAREMKERIAALVGEEQSHSLRMGTFHSVFARILRYESTSIGYGQDFTIYDQTDARSLTKAIIKELGLDEKIYRPTEVHNRILAAKNRLITAQAYAEDKAATSRDDSDKMPAVHTIYSLYQGRLRTANAMDFDDLLVNAWALFDNNPDIQRRYAESFKYILVDEYQDTNYAQQQIILQLTSAHQHICAVGDDAQSIYGFRGANIDNILDFQSKFDNARLFKLEQNYRSTQRIVQAANSLIERNERQIPKNIFSRNDEGDNISLTELASDREEALFICKDIKRLMREEALDYSDFAVLYRTNFQSRTFEEQMMKVGMPYRVYGSLSFYQRKEIKDVLAYFRLVINHHDEEALKRIINYPTRGIGQTTIDKVTAAANANSCSMWHVMTDSVQTGLNVNKGTQTKLTNFTQLIDNFTAQLTETDAFTLAQDIIKLSGISQEIYSSKDPEYLSRQTNVEEFLSSIQDFVESQREQDLPTTLTDYLHDVALLSDRDDKNDDSPRVTLMTIHSAKGLEFPCVYVAGMEENLFPSPLCTASKRMLEEERRLLYVAITRAERHCMLTYARTRYRYGSMEFDPPSRFLNDIDKKYVTMVSPSGGSSFTTGKGRKSFFGSMPEYETEKPYTGARYGNNARQYGSTYGRQQNANPVASQFMADPKPKITAPKQAPKTANPFSEQFLRQLQSSGANMRKVDSAMRNGGRASAMNPTYGAGSTAAPSAGSTANGQLQVGQRVSHNRFGLGTVTRLEGTDASRKAYVDFDNEGEKQLLLRFARLQVVQ